MMQRIKIDGLEYVIQTREEWRRETGGHGYSNAVYDEDILWEGVPKARWVMEGVSEP